MSVFASHPSRSTRHLRKALALGTILCSGLAVPVLAQSTEGLPRPAVQSSPDSYGVDLATGALNLSVADITVGAGGVGLAHKRYWLGSNLWRDEYDITLVEANGKVTISAGGSSRTFTSSNGVYTSDQGDGSSLVNQNGTYTLTESGGTVTTFGYSDYRDGVRATQVRQATGETLTFAYRYGTYWIRRFNSEPIDVDMSRLESVTSSDGYRLTFRYVTDSAATSQQAQQAWLQRSGVTIENTARGGTAGTTSYGYSSGSGGGTITITDNASRTTTYATDTAGRVTSVTMPGESAASLVFGYNAAGRVGSVTDATGVATYTYSDSNGRRTTQVTTPNGGQSTYVFDIATSRMVSATTAAGLITSYAYDGKGRLETVVSNGVSTHTGYDGNGNVTETRVTARDGSTNYVVASALFPCTSAATCDKPQWTKNARGGQTDYLYDQVTGNVLTITAPPDANAVRAVTTFNYKTVNGAQRLDSKTICTTAASCANSADEQVTTIGYDANALPASVTVRSGNGAVSATTAVVYDIVGNAVTVDGPLSGSEDTTTIRCNGARQVVGTVGPDPDGSGPQVRQAQRTTYDQRGRAYLVEQGTVTDASDSAWSNFTSAQQVTRTFDGADRVLTQKLTAGGNTYAVAQNSYDGRHLDCAAIRMNGDAWGTLPTSACTAQAAGGNGPDRITKYEYDGGDRVKTTIRGYSTSQAITERATYTATGAPASVTDGNTNVTNYGYDGYDRPRTTTFPGGSYEQIDYDAYGYLRGQRLRSGETISRGYDALGRMTALSPQGERGVAYRYDMLGQLREAAYDGLGSADSVTFAYDALGRVTATTSRKAGVARTLGYAYDMANNRTTLTHPDGVVFTNGYDMTGAMRSGTWTIPSGTASFLSITNDSLGRRTAIAHASSLTSYGYDPASRLTAMSQGYVGGNGNTNVTLSYNAAGQITSRAESSPEYARPPFGPVDRSYQANALNQYASVAGQAYGYDGRGNLTSDGVNSYGYDLSNRMTNATTGSGATALAYDPLGRLWQLTNGGTSTQFLYDGNHVVAEYDGNSGAMRRRYYWGPAADEPILQDEGSLMNCSSTRILLTDERGSVVGQADCGGNRQQTNRYDEFGRPAAENWGRFQYTGQAWLPEIGLYYYKARMYSPMLGRFMQTDPIGYGDGLNMYDYVGGDPVNNVDPTGLEGAAGCFVNDPDGSACTPAPGRGGGGGSSVYYYDPYSPWTGGSGSSGGCPTGWYRINGQCISDATVYFRGRSAVLPSAQASVTVPQNTCGNGGSGSVRDFLWGAGDVALLGFGDELRDALGIDPVNMNSTAYTAGEITGSVALLATGVGGGIRAAGVAARGLEFSHFIPRRMGGARSIWNGNFVSTATHALSDPFRYRFMPKSWKAANPMPNRASQLWTRTPNTAKGTAAGAGAAGTGLANAGC